MPRLVKSNGIIVILVIITSIPLLYFIGGRMQQCFAVRKSSAGVLSTDFEQLVGFDQSGLFDILWYIRTNTALEARVLAYRKNEVLTYGNRPFAVYDAPEFLPLYSANSVEVAHSFLRSRGIKYILLPPYISPLISTTVLQELLLSPDRVRLIMATSGYQLYEVLDDVSSVHIKEIDSIQSADWKLVEDEAGSYFLKKRLMSLGVSKKFAYSKYTGGGELYLAPTNVGSASSILPNSLYRLKARAKGKGILKIFVFFYDENGAFCNTTLIWNGVLQNNSERPIGMQFCTPFKAATYRIAYKYDGLTSGVIENVEIDHVAIGDVSLQKKYDVKVKVEMERLAQDVLKERARGRIYNYSNVELRSPSFVFSQYTKRTNNHDFTLRTDDKLYRVNWTTKGRGFFGVYFVAKSNCSASTLVVPLGLCKTISNTTSFERIVRLPKELSDITLYFVPRSMEDIGEKDTLYEFIDVTVMARDGVEQYQSVVRKGWNLLTKLDQNLIIHQNKTEQ